MSENSINSGDKRSNKKNNLDKGKTNGEGTEEAKNEEAKASNFISVSDFTSKGIFGPDGYLNALKDLNGLQTLNLEAEKQENKNPDASIKNVPSGSFSRKGNRDEVGNKTHFECSLIDSALDLDHILEKILSYLSVPDLKTVRLVSHRLQHFGAAQLQKLTHLEVSFSSKTEFAKTIFQANPEYPNEIISQLGIARLKDCKEKDIGPEFEDLLSLMEASTNFPCASYEFDSQNLSSTHIQRFLNTAGPFIKRLKLTLPILLANPKLPFQDHTFIDDIRTILLEQLPNLEKFELELWLPRRWSQDMANWFEDSNHFFDQSCVDRRNNNCNNIGMEAEDEVAPGAGAGAEAEAGVGKKSSEERLKKDFPILPNLKTFILRGTGPISKVIFEEVKQAAINLKTGEFVEYPYLTNI